MTYPLAPHQNFEDLAQAVSTYTKRPVFTTGYWGSSGATHIRFPGEDTWSTREDPRTRPLARFLSTLDAPVCHERDGDIFRFIAREAPVLYLAVPLIDYREKSHVADAFQRFGIRSGYNTTDVPVTDKDQELLDQTGLAKFASLRTHPARLRGQRIIFAVSAPYIRPVEVRDWHFAPDPLADGSKLLQTPGHYNPDLKLGSAFDWNRYIVTDMDPGDCIACRGQSGDRKHFGHLSFPGPVRQGLLCRTCFGPFTEFVKQALAD